uniref:TSA: Wollemia nobilis Ref_Wollemi_Transcript_7540_2252 transcribed RNA sequence n=1 Tax=Wollemia nobilis TaxID=56998 RepID=A0A0C9RX28_9CONI
MSFPYSSSSSANRFLGYQGDRPRHGIVRWSESQECNSNSESRRGGRFSDQLRIREGLEGEGDCEGGRCREFSRNSSAGEVDGARSHTGGRPPSPSPICSPTNSCSPACSPRDVNGVRSARSPVTGDYDSRTEGSTESRNGGDSRGKRPVGESNQGEEADPSSSRSNNSSLALFTGNLCFSRENKPAPENPEDDNEEIRDIPMTEDRSRSTATANNSNSNNNNQMIPSLRRPRQPNWSDTSMGSFISSDAESISLSTEFNAVLAAAAAAGTNSSAQAAAESERLRSILEEEPSRTTSADEGDEPNNYNNSNSNTRDNMALVPADNNNNNNGTTPPSGGGQHQGNRDQRGGRDYLALVPMNGTHESTDRDAPSSSWDAQNNERAMINHVDSGGNGNANGSGSGSGNRGYGSTLSSAGRNSKDVPTPKQLALQKVKRDRIEAKAVAWEEAKTAEVDNRYKREDAIVTAWENEQKVQASIRMKKVERKLEEKRAKAFEKMQNEIARAHRKAEERRAMAEARKGAEKAKITEAVEKIRAFGRVPRKFLIF